LSSTARDREIPAGVVRFETRQENSGVVARSALKVVLVWFDNWLLMSESGRKRAASAAECAEVRRLAANGASVRQIARDVFGDQRFRGRVERILQAPEAPNKTDGSVVIGQGSDSVETVPAVRAALARYLARIARGEVNPSVGEMVSSSN
jgi:hypothetical protein